MRIKGKEGDIKYHFKCECENHPNCLKVLKYKNEYSDITRRLNTVCAKRLTRHKGIDYKQKFIRELFDNRVYVDIKNN